MSKTYCKVNSESDIAIIVDAEMARIYEMEGPGKGCNEIGGGYGNRVDLIAKLFSLAGEYKVKVPLEVIRQLLYELMEQNEF